MAAELISGTHTVKGDSRDHAESPCTCLLHCSTSSQVHNAAESSLRLQHWWYSLRGAGTGHMPLHSVTMSTARIPSFFSPPVPHLSGPLLADSFGYARILHAIQNFTIDAFCHFVSTQVPHEHFRTQPQKINSTVIVHVPSRGTLLVSRAQYTSPSSVNSTRFPVLLEAETCRRLLRTEPKDTIIHSVEIVGFTQVPLTYSDMPIWHLTDF